jgi:hypothetical protein
MDNKNEPIPPPPALPETAPVAELTPEQAELRDKITAFIIEKWGIPLPACPYCRYVAWVADPLPVSLQRYGFPTGFGVPVFLVWCTNCGHEVPISVATTGLWNEVFPPVLPPDATAAE